MQKLEELPELLTVKQIAEHMGLHPNSVYLRCTSGELKSFKSGNSRRIRKEAYIEWIKTLESQGNDNQRVPKGTVQKRRD